MTKNDMAGGRRKSTQPKRVRSQSGDEPLADAAFDVWLNRGLHQLYDDVAREPIPDELLRIIEADRSRAEPAGGATPPAAPETTEPALHPRLGDS